MAQRKHNQRGRGSLAAPAPSPRRFCLHLALPDLGDGQGCSNSCNGAKYVADQAGAIVDEIALARRGNNRVTAEAFQLWRLTVNLDRTATLRCEDGNGHVVYKQGDSVHGFSAVGDCAVFHQRGDFAAGRVLTGGMLTMALHASSRSTAAAICGAIWWCCAAPKQGRPSRSRRCSPCAKIAGQPASAPQRVAIVFTVLKRSR